MENYYGVNSSDFLFVPIERVGIIFSIYIYKRKKKLERKEENEKRFFSSLYLAIFTTISQLSLKNKNNFSVVYLKIGSFVIVGCC